MFLFLTYETLLPFFMKFNSFATFAISFIFFPAVLNKTLKSLLLIWYPSNILPNNESISEWLIWLLLLKTKLFKFGIFFPLPGDQLVSFLLKPLTFLVFKNLKNLSLSNSILASSIENIGDNNVLS